MYSRRQKATKTQSMSAVSWGKGHKVFMVTSLENRHISTTLNCREMYPLWRMLLEEWLREDGNFSEMR